MRNRLSIIGLGSAALLCFASTAAADPKLRVQVDQKGDFVLFGNTLGYECAAAAMTPAPVVGTAPGLLQCGLNLGDTSPDVLWRSDSPVDGDAEASTAITAAQARSTAMLVVPPGAAITHAYLYWGAKGTGANADLNVQLDRIGPGEFSASVDAIDSYTQSQGRYHSVADVTALVQANGPGAYRVGGLDIKEFANANDAALVAGWWMVVFYKLDTDPPRNLALFDGFDLVSNGNPQNVSITGFLVPEAGFDAKLGVATYEADNGATGDQLFFYKGADPGMPLSDALNAADNFFNSSRSFLGTPVSVVGDLPQLTGEPQSMSGMDLDVIDVKGKLASGDTSANIRATSSSETYQLAMFVTSISTFKPDFSSSLKTAKDVNGGALVPGDEIEYTIAVTNTGNDTSVNTVLTDVLPKGVTYVPGSIAITAGPGAGTLTDQVSDDLGEFDAGQITVRLGTGANAMMGGALLVGESTTVTFKVTVNADATGTIANQAVITAGGEQGAVPESTPTDGNGAGNGQPPTEVIIGGMIPGEDSDGDGLDDETEGTLGTDPNDADSDDDGVSDGQEPGPDQDTDGDGLINALDPDSDNDGLFDGTELGLQCSNPATDITKGHCTADEDKGATKTDPLDADTDDGGATDGSEDTNLNGLIDEGETNPTTGHGDDDADEINKDTDGDGLSDNVEVTIGTDPNDADSDNDGLLDGQEPNPTDDTDGDGKTNALDPDSDGDGLFDGTELGKDCSNAATDPADGTCIPDGDSGATKTSSLDPDTDDGGVTDGDEDKNHNGVVDADETDPTVGHGADDTTGPGKDADGDGLLDDKETEIGTNPNDGDSDDDGVPDGQEPKPGEDADGDGLINALDADSDNDGLFDGTELGKDCSGTGTDVEQGHCKPDADMGATKTNPLRADTDSGGVTDGSEDTNLNGVVDAGETDPTTGNGADDKTVTDTDGDGLSDGLEATLGTDPKDADSDNDGLLDGEEANPAEDTDGDGQKNAVDPDSDNDGLFDGTELGKDCSNAATDAEAGTCIPDADNMTKTSPLDPDTDGGGTKDGDEDKNHNGKLDAGETDPTKGHGADDKPSGTLSDGIFFEGNGLLCSARPGSTTGGTASIFGLALAAALAWQRRRRHLS